MQIIMINSWNNIKKIPVWRLWRAIKLTEIGEECTLPLERNQQHWMRFALGQLFKWGLFPVLTALATRAQARGIPYAGLRNQRMKWRLLQLTSPVSLVGSWITHLYERVQASQVALLIKNLPANSGDARDDTGLIPGPGRSPGGGHGNLLQYSCLENPMNSGAWLLRSTGSQRVGHDLACKHRRQSTLNHRGYYWATNRNEHTF